MLNVEIDGGVELRERMRKFTPDLADRLENEMRFALNPIVRKARGFVPASAPLSKWNLYSQQRKGNFPYYDAAEIRNGIYLNLDTTKPNRKGFSYAASIVNSTAGGAIYETAGRKNPNGRKQNPMVNYYANAGTKNATLAGRKRDSNKRLSQSDNPNAGKQFIDAMGVMYKVARIKGQSGRVSKKFNGRLIFRAWGEDQGKVNNAVLIAIDKAVKEFHARTKSRYTTSTMKRAA